MKKRIAVVHCVGTMPLLMDPMTDDTLDSLITGVRKQKSKDESPEVTAAGKLYRENGDSGPVGIPAECLFACLSGAGRNIKNGKKQISTASSTTIPSFMRITKPFLPLSNVPEGEEDNFWVVDKRRGQLHNAGKSVAVPIIRPKFNQWEFDVEIEFDADKIDESTLKALVEEAGASQGLLSFRPNRNGPFGTFRVASWEVQEMSKDEGVAAAA